MLVKVILTWRLSGNYMLNSSYFSLEVLEKDGSSHYYSTVSYFAIHDGSDLPKRELEISYSCSAVGYESEFPLESIERIRINPFSDKPILLFYNGRRVN